MVVMLSGEGVVTPVDVTAVDMTAVDVTAVDVDVDVGCCFIVTDMKMPTDRTITPITIERKIITSASYGPECIGFSSRELEN